MKLTAKGRIWIDTPDGAFLGNGKIELLGKIQETGSLRKAAAEMQLSYQQAWHMVSNMNNKLPEPLVVLQRGGKGGGQAMITPTGQRAIELFKQLQTNFQAFLHSQQLSL